MRDFFDKHDKLIGRLIGLIMLWGASWIYSQKMNMLVNKIPVSYTAASVFVALAGVYLIITGGVTKQQKVREQAAKEAQERAAREAQLAAQSQPVIQNPCYEEWWEETTKTIPVSQMANDVDAMIDVYNSCPNTYANRKRLLDFFKMLAPDTLAQITWTCEKCGKQNTLGSDCSCGYSFFFWTCPVCGKRNRIGEDCSCGEKHQA